LFCLFQVCVFGTFICVHYVFFAYCFAYYLPILRIFGVKWQRPCGLAWDAVPEPMVEYIDPYFFLMQLLIGLYSTPFISITVLRLGLNCSVVDSDAVFDFLLHCQLSIGSAIENRKQHQLEWADEDNLLG
jgi:hypothetical protein